MDTVRVTLPATAAAASPSTSGSEEEPYPGRMYELTGTESNYLDDDPSWVDRWVPAIAQTGYTPPLQITYILDAHRQVQSMPVDDLRI